MRGMTADRPRSGLVLGLQPTSRGIGFAVLEGTLRLVDWGVRETKKDKNRDGLRKIDALLDFYDPAVLVLENHHGQGSRRASRIRELLDAITERALARGLPVRHYSRGQVRHFFSHYDAQNKHQIATTIAGWLPELALRLPPPRKPWMSEDYRMAIFDAAAFALTYFHRRRIEERGGG